MSKQTRDLTVLEKLLADPKFHLEGREPDGDLLESMKAHGWLAAFPAVTDAEGNLIAGHRRMAAAKKLGIEPVIKQLPANTPLADRIRLALLSNVGGKPFTRKQRQTVAEHLYGQKGWTMAKIGEALKVSTKTVSQDLEGFYPEKKPDRPKGGRPRKAEQVKGTKQTRDEFRKELEQALGDKGAEKKDIPTLGEVLGMEVVGVSIEINGENGVRVKLRECDYEVVNGVLLIKVTNLETLRPQVAESRKPTEAN